MDRDVNPLVLLIGVLLYSIASSFLYGIETVVLLALTLLIPFFFRTNTLHLLWRMKVMLFTALLILAFGIIEKRNGLSVTEDVCRFLSLITVASLFVLKADLLTLSSTLGNILSKVFGKGGWKASSYLTLTLSVFPLVFESGSEMLTARKARSGSFFTHPVRNLTEYTVSLMTLLFDKVLVFQDALYSRSFTTTGEKTAYPLTRRDITLFMFFVLVFTGVIVWKKIL